MFDLKILLPILSVFLISACSSVDVGPVQRKIADTKSNPAGACIVASHQAAVDLAEAESMIAGKQTVSQSTYDKAMLAAQSAASNRQTVIDNCYVPAQLLTKAFALHVEEYTLFRINLERIKIYCAGSPS